MSEDVIKLIFPPHLRIPGDVVEGEVDLDFRAMQHSTYECVEVRLLGSVFSKISRAAGYTSYTTEETVMLVRHSATLWRHGEAYPPAGTDILKLPFRFTLPSTGLLPSCSFDNKIDLAAKVIYWVDVIAVRPGLHFNKEISCPFPLLPIDTAGAELGQALRSGWTGPWREIFESRPIRKGLWGEYANAKWTLTLPAIAAFPVMTPIPFTLHIITVSKPMKREDTPAHGSIFPTPPHSPQAGVEIRLMRNVLIKARIQDGGSYGTLVAHLGGFGHESSPTRVDTDIKDPVWIPGHGNEKKQLGSWKQEVTFQSTFELTCPPTFSSSTMSVNYFVEVKVEFPGVGNNLTGEFPVDVVSNIATTHRHGWDGPPPELELPPYCATAQPDTSEKIGSTDI